jgi:hypothetical protein
MRVVTARLFALLFKRNGLNAHAHLVGAGARDYIYDSKRSDGHALKKNQ